MNLHLGVHQISDVSNHDSIRFRAGLLKNVELLHRRLARDPGMREDAKICLRLRPAHRAKHFALGVGDLVPTADLA